MDFLTINFADYEATSAFDGYFRLLDLPLEILFKILIFLDDPDLQNLGKTCRHLRIAASERFITRSKFLYVKQKLGISLQLRPSSKDLYQRNILPTSSKDLLTNFSPAHFEVSSSLQKSFKRDRLLKRLSQRPSKDELKCKNIIPEKETSDFVKNKLKEFKKENISQMLELHTHSSLYQNSIISIKEEKSPIEDVRQIIPGWEEVTDDFTRVYLQFFKRFNKNNHKRIDSTKSFVCASSDGSPIFKITDLLNHIGTTTGYLSSGSPKGNAGGKDKKKNNIERIEVSKVRSVKEYFESLSSSEGYYNPTGSDDTHKESEIVAFGDISSRKQSRTMLKASVIKGSLINYEKIY